MATKTKPVRIFESDHRPLRLIAEAQGCKPAEVFHAALLEYLHANSEDLSQLFDEAGEAIANSDLDQLTALASRSIDAEVDAAMARHADL